MADTPTKTFPGAEADDIAIKHRGDQDTIVIGDRTFPIRPLNPIGAAKLFKLISRLLETLSGSIGGLARGDASFGDLMSNIGSALPENFDLVIDLVLATLQRSTPSLDREYLEQNLDVVQLEDFWAIFARQNRVMELVKKISGALAPALQEGAIAAAARSASESPSSQPSSADTTDGPPTSSSDETPTGTNQTN